MPCFFVLYSLPQSRSNFLVSGIHRLVCPPRSTPTASCLHPHNLASGQFRRHLQNVNIHSSSRLAVSTTSSGRYPPLTSSQNPSLLFQGLIMLQRDLCCWACKLLSCIQLVILLELPTKSLQNRCNQFGGYTFNYVVCISRFIRSIYEASFARSSK